VHCRQAYEPDTVTRKAIEQVIGNFEMLYRGAGCPRCRGTGYSGRVGIFELFLPSEKILEAVGNGASLHEIRSKLSKKEYTTLRQDGLRKATEGLTTPDEVFYSTAIG
jgi:type IV pilus assembly protein PilB